MVVSVGLMFIPGMQGAGAMLLASVIGSAIGTLVNGGNFKSFAIGVGIGIAAGYIARGVGSFLSGGANAWANFTANWYGAAFEGALAGTASGTISSVVYGQNVEKGLAKGASYGAITGAAISFGKSVVKEMFSSHNPYAGDPIIQACVMDIAADPKDVDLTWHYEEEWREVGRSDFRLLEEYADVSLTLECGYSQDGRTATASKTIGETIYLYPADKAAPPGDQWFWFEGVRGNERGVAVYGYTSTMARCGRLWNVTYDSGWFKIPGTPVHLENFGRVPYSGKIYKTDNHRLPYRVDHRSPVIPSFERR